MKKVKATTLALLLLTCVALGGVHAYDHSALMHRANRVLQEGVKVNITRDPAIKRFCDDAGIPETTIAISEEERQSLFAAKIKGKYSSLIVEVDKAMQDNGFQPQAVVKAAFATGIGFGIVAACLAFLSLIFIIVWSITECCCEKTCCVDQQKKGEGRGFFRWTCYIVSAILALTTIALTIAWSVSLAKFTKRFPELTCAISILKSDVINGVQINSTSVFVGADQANVLLGNYVSLFESINSIKTNAENVKSKQLTTKADSVVSQANSFSTSFNAASYQHSGVFNPSTQVTVGFALLVKASADNGGLKVEANSLSEIAKSIDNAVKTIANYDQSSAKSTIDMLTSAQNTLEVSLKQPLQNLFNTFTSNSDGADAYFKRASTGFIVTSVLVVIVLSLIYFLILGFNIKDRWYPMRFLLKIIMILQLLLAVLILIMGSVLTGATIFFTYTCTAIDGAITTPNYLAVNLKGTNASPELIRITNNCLYVNGDGNLFTALNIDLAKVNDIGNITSGLQSYINFKGNLTNQSAPYLGGMLFDNITAGINSDLELPGSPAAEDTITGMAKFNSYTCLKDQVYLKTGPPTRSTAGDSAAQDKGLTYSIIRHDGSYSGSKYAGRYNLGTECTTLPTGTTTAQANTYLTNLLTVQDGIQTTYLNLRTDFGAGFYTAENNLFTDMKASTTDLDAIYSKVNSAIDYLNSANSTLPLLLDCRVIRKEVTLFSNILCFRLYEDFYVSSGLGLALGFVLFIYSWFMCCSIRMTTKKKDENNGALYQDANNRGGAFGTPAYQNGQQYNDYK